MPYEANRRVETSVRTFAIIEHLREVGPARISTLARELEVSKGIIHNHVSTLRELGYVIKLGEHYQLSPKLLSVGMEAREQTPLYTTATALLERYATQHETSAILFQDAGSNTVVVAPIQVPNSLELTIGASLARGRSLPGVVTLIEREEMSITIEAYDEDRLAAALKRDGYAIGPLAVDSDDISLAFPVTDEEEVCHGSVCLILPDDEEAAERIRESASTLNERIMKCFQQSSDRSFMTEKHSWIVD